MIITASASGLEERGEVDASRQFLLALSEPPNYVFSAGVLLQSGLVHASRGGVYGLVRPHQALQSGQEHGVALSLLP
jgi:hypothetical protein